MAVRRLLALEMSNDFSLALDSTTPDNAYARIESHSCYYASYENSLSYCTFTLTFHNPAPEPGLSAGLGAGLIALAVLGRNKSRVRS